MLGTNEQSVTDALLLFCIDVSGSMSITSQARKNKTEPNKMVVVGEIKKKIPNCGVLNVRSLLF